MAVQDKKVTDLTPLDNVTSDDLLLVVNDPNGNPTSRRVSFGGVFGNVNFNTAFTANVSVNGTDVFKGINDKLQVANATALINDKISVANTLVLLEQNKANTIIDFENAIIERGVITLSANIKLEIIANTVFANNTVSVKDTVIIREQKPDPATTNAQFEGIQSGSIFYSNSHIYVATDNNTIKSVVLDLDLEETVSGVSNNQFQSYVSNTNSRLVTLESTSPTGTVSNTDFQSYVANTNARVGTVETDLQSYIANTNPRLDNPIHASFTITANGTSGYCFSGSGAANTNNETLYLYKGFTYEFINTTGVAHPFQILNVELGPAFANGVSGSQTGTQLFTVPHAQQSNLVYQCSIHSGMLGTLVIVT
jgi:hypothetical protein